MGKKVGTVTWLKGLTFDAEIDGRHVMIDGAPGFGDGRGPTPMQLLMLSLAGCTAMDVVSILKKSRQPVTDLIVRAEGEQAAEHPKRYTAISLTFEVHGSGVDRGAVERAVKLSSERYCSVKASLAADLTVATSIEMIEEAVD